MISQTDLLLNHGVITCDFGAKFCCVEVRQSHVTAYVISMLTLITLNHVSVRSYNSGITLATAKHCLLATSRALNDIKSAFSGSLLLLT